ncbi:hypothetical protein BRC82_01215 [Halobacteriales archaeon QS_1_67_19]|nr:MAG: hypothetical protein BRC82_01215 [Halobacteriales archaeon QS_1_67_19]
MTEKFTAVDSRTDRTGLRRSGRGRPRDWLADARALLTVTRLGAVALALLVVYLAYVVPADFALLLAGTLFAVAAAAMVPLAAVAVVTWFVE